MQIPLHSDHHVAFNKLKYTIVKTTTNVFLSHVLTNIFKSALLSEK